jgi:FkbH-like protein
MENLKFSEIVTKNREFINLFKEQKKIKIKILSNLTISVLREILLFELFNQNIPSEIEIADYDNFVQESVYDQTDIYIYFWETINIIDNIYYKINNWDNNEIENLLLKTKKDIQFVFNNLKNAPLVLFNHFTSVHYSSYSSHETRIENFANDLNTFINQNKPLNTRIIDTNKIFSRLGLNNSIDNRFYFTTKTIYTLDFYKEYVKIINNQILKINGKLKKALIIDCDNTLWGGVLGEDGFNGIEMDANTNKGGVFSIIQHLLLDANKNGILLCICSKNNFNDVIEVFENHKSMVLKKENITIFKVNWDNKVTNIIQIAKELNIGLDSFIFIDDSTFEINNVKQFLPDVALLQVPFNLNHYPNILLEKLSYFFNNNSTNEDKIRNKLYVENNIRKKEIETHVSIESYLNSLAMELQISQDDICNIERISQLTQKTNQFNLTTKRYSETEIKSLMESKIHTVFSFQVSDKFGNNGLTAVIIIEFNDPENAIIDTFLMSCRIIGRNIEYFICEYVINYLRDKNIFLIHSDYLETIKNSQVSEFFDKCGFKITEEKTNSKKYLFDKHCKFQNSIKYINIRK